MKIAENLYTCDGMSNPSVYNRVKTSIPSTPDGF